MEHASSRFVAEDALVLGVPFDLTAYSHGDIAQMGDRNGTMGHLDRRCGSAATFDAIDEIAMYTLAFVQALLIRSDGLELLHILSVGQADCSVGPFETHPGGLVGYNYSQAIGIVTLEIEFRGRVPEGIAARVDSSAFHRLWARIVHARPPMRHVDKVGAPVGDLPAGIVVDPAEGPVTTLARIWGPGGRTQPHIVIQPLRDGHWRWRILIAWIMMASGQANVDRVEFADAAVAHEVAAHAARLAAAPLAAALEDSAVTLDRVGHGSTFDYAVAQRLLAIYVLAASGCGDGNERMPMIRGGDHDSVDILAAQKIAEVAIAVTAPVRSGRGLLGVVFFDQIHRRAQSPMPIFLIVAAALVRIADRNDLNIGLAQEVLQIDCTHAADADSAHGDPIARRHRAGVAQSRRRDHIGKPQGSAASCDLLDEITTG